MRNLLPGVVPILIITLICVGLVEGGYLLIENFILVPPKGEKVIEKEIVTNQSAAQTGSEKTVDYRVILQRNLFGSPPDSGKSELPSALVPTEVLPASNLDLVLMGTIKGSLGTERAVILDKKAQKQRLYMTGDAVEGVFVKEIMKGKIILSYNGRDEILDMSKAAKERPKVGAIPVAPVPGRAPVRGVPRPFASVAPAVDMTNVPMSTQNPTLKPTERKSAPPPRVSRPSRQLKIE